MQTLGHTPRGNSAPATGGRARSLRRARLAVMVCMALLAPYLANGPVGSVLGASPATAESAEPDMPEPPPVCTEHQTRDCIKAYDEVRMTVTPTVITLPDLYPACIGGAYSGMDPTGTCEQLTLSFDIDFPSCADVGTGVDCYESIAWGTPTRSDIWYPSWTFAGVFSFLKSEPGQCAAGSLTCDRFFLTGSADKDLGGTGWLILSDPQIRVRDHSTGSSDPSDYQTVPYWPEVAVHVPPAETESPTADFDFTVDDDNTGIVEFTSTSTEPEGRALDAVWDFGDGSTGTGDHATHRYAESGLYNVTLTVTTSATGAFDTVSKPVVVEVVDPERPLVVNSIGDAPVIRENQSVALNNGVAIMAADVEVADNLIG